ncbi:unannotated protein [freshwater metagenome]|uniref:Unannotated protein n=1 Tax=freshwater metagenome TaxID=449393 RepID=A0A6J7KN89_9ZZZZ
MHIVDLREPIYIYENCKDAALLSLSKSEQRAAFVLEPIAIEETS